MMNYKIINVNHLLPKHWDINIIEIVGRFGEKTVLDGNHSTSIKEKGALKSIVKIVNGEITRIKLSWLYNLYQNDFLRIANEVWENEVIVSEDENSAVTINFIEDGNHYELHKDSNCLTGLLFVTTNKTGALLLKTEKEEIDILPEKGMLVLFDGKNIPHKTKPLIGEPVRISVPMNFYFKGNIPINWIEFK